MVGFKRLVRPLLRPLHVHRGYNSLLGFSKDRNLRMDQGGRPESSSAFYSVLVSLLHDILVTFQNDDYGAWRNSKRCR